MFIVACCNKFASFFAPIHHEELSNCILLFYNVVHHFFICQESIVTNFVFTLNLFYFISLQ
jgi:hypothetical protein